MKHSISKIFSNLKLYLFLLSVFVFFSILIVAEQGLEYKKNDILKQEVLTAKTVLSLNEVGKEEAISFTQAKGEELLHNITELKNLYKYAFVEQFLTNNQKKYLMELKTLQEHIQNFNASVQKHYRYILKYDKVNKAYKNNMNREFLSLKQQINSMQINILEYSQDKFNLSLYMMVGIFLFISLIGFWYSRRLKSIYTDILYLYSINKDDEDYKIFTEEIDVLSLRINRKQSNN